MLANDEVFMDADDNGVLIARDPQGILDHQLRPRPIHLLNISIIFILITF
jgi:hypothetical protein